MKINGIKVNLCKDIIIPAAKSIKNMFNFKRINLVREPATDTFEISLLKEDVRGITSKTFQQLLTPEFTPKVNADKSGLKITTLIDKKTNRPVNAFVAMIEENMKDTERYCIMVEDAKGDLDINNKKYRVVGETYFHINQKQKMITPKFEQTFINGEPYEKVFSYMKAMGNNEYGGIGTRLHQLRVERMLQNGLGNVCIVADGSSFPFHYATGYRLTAVKRPIEDATKILQDFSNLNKKTPKENFKYLFLEPQENDKYVINWSATLEHFLADYYKNGGTPIKDFSPNMFLTETSLRQWIEMIRKQPILY